MIVPSIDIQAGRAVQLRRGRELVLDGGDPLDRLEQFAVVGEVAVVDLDAALGDGANTELMREMVRRHPCRVGGGIRDLASAEGWLDAGAAKIVLGTAANEAFVRLLPRERVIAAVDAENGTVVDQGWRRSTGDPVLERIERLAPHVGGFLLTQVQHEGAMEGFDLEILERAREFAADVRITAAGGITNGEEVAALDRMDVDAQVGMALYGGRLSLGEAFAAPLTKSVDDVWPTVVTATTGEPLGLVWSTRETVAQAVNEARGIYWSRSRNRRWVKGESSGDTQELARALVDCDRDALTFVVRQSGSGFCHTGSRSCFGDFFGLEHLEATLHERITTGDPSSGTVKLADDPLLLAAKLREEAGELLAAHSRTDVTHEAADVFYFTLVAMARSGVALGDVVRELERRHGRVTRRPMRAKSNAEAGRDG